MSEMFNYRSVLAPYMNSLLEMKASAGVSGQRIKWILKEFDDFTVSEKFTDPHITSNFIAKWRTTRVADCDRTRLFFYLLPSLFFRHDFRISQIRSHIAVQHCHTKK